MTSSGRARKGQSQSRDLPLGAVQAVPRFKLCAQPREVDPELEQLAPDTVVEYEEDRAGSKGVGRTQAGDLVAHIRDVMERQSRGFYTLAEASQAIADATPGIDAAQLLESMQRAHRDGTLYVRSVSTQLRLKPGAPLRDFLDWVTPDDVDAMLEGERAAYRFPRVVGDRAPAHKHKHIPAQRRQEDDVLAKLRELGIDPLKVPRPRPGLPSPAKKAVREALGFTEDVMGHAWKRLRKDGRLKDA